MIEQRLLGCILREPTFLDKIPNLKPHHFLMEDMGKIYGVLVDLYEHGVMPSIFAYNYIFPACRGIGIDLAEDSLKSLKNASKIDDDICELASLIVEAKEQKILNDIGTWLQEQLFDGNNSEKIRSELINRLSETNNSLVDLVHISDAVSLATKDAENRAILFRQGKPTGITTGNKEYDELTRGWQKGTLNILAGRSGQGKSSYALYLAQSAAKSGSPGIFFSIEMSNTELLGKVISSKINGLTYDSYLRGDIKDHHFKDMQFAEEELGKLPIHFNDSTLLKLKDIESTIRRFKRKGQCEWVIIDYLQKIKVYGEGKRTREQIVSEISWTLKNIAKELEIPIIALAQLNREVEGRGNNIPILSDLRESGSIEQDADTVTFIYRPAKYDKTEINHPKHGIITDLLDKAILVLAKNRHGACGSIIVRHNPELSIFYDYDHDYSNITENYHDTNPF